MYIQTSCCYLLLIKKTEENKLLLYCAASILNSPHMGINYGTLGDNLPKPVDAVASIQSLGFRKVKLFEPDAAILAALAHSGLEVVVGVPNGNITGIASSATSADTWIEDNIAPYYPATNIVMIVVGNEVFRGQTTPAMEQSVVPAMQNLQTSLVKRNWAKKMKLTTTVTLEMLTSIPPLTTPSSSSIRSNLQQYLLPLFEFLQSTDSYLFLNWHPIWTYWTQRVQYPLSYYMLEPSINEITDGNHVYTNIFETQLDAVYAALAKIGYGELPLAISETGWPTAGDSTQVGPSIANAQAYNQRLINKVLSAQGTPLRPNTFVPTFIFALFNEDLKTGPSSEKHWGLLYPNREPVYSLNVTT
jgi:exo-beta-1,3-glucanase (GH17 family)